MSEVSPVLGLPYIQGAQAQKHVTHNEAIRLLDVAVQLTALRRDLTAPLPDPEIGDCYIVADGATGLWAGQARRIAVFATGGWEFFVPRPGWRAHVLDEAQDVVFDGLDWVGPEASDAQFARLGVGTSGDATNRLSVASPATLFTHAGTDHRMNVNRAGSADTASLLFQTGFSGRAEMGLAGSDDFEVKVSPDGSAFATALQIAAASGRVVLPVGMDLAGGTAAAPSLAFATDAASGLFLPASETVAIAAGGTERLRATSAGVEVSGLLSGTAVTQTATDTTPGRVTRTGDFGIGNPAGVAIEVATDVNDARPAGLYHVGDSAANAFGAADHPLVELASTDAARRAQLAVLQSGTPDFGFRTREGGTWSNWRRVWHDHNTLGTVALNAGLPTGALVERGETAAGSYVRWADGTMACWHEIDEDEPIATGFLGGYRSAPMSWTYPSAFAATPALLAQPLGLTAMSVVTDTVGTSAASLAVTAVTSQTSAQRRVAVLAIGRWG